MTFSKMANHVKPQPPLIAALEKRLAGTQPARPYARIHASMLTYGGKKYCPREVALCDITGKSPKDEYINATLQATFDMGWKIHHMVTDNWLNHIAVGHWKCVRCQSLSPFGPYPQQCGGRYPLSRGGAPCTSQGPFEYEEENFQHRELKHTGSIDMLADLSDHGYDKLIAVEIKSIDKDEFKELKAPKAEHRVRSQLYLDIIANSDSEVRDMVDHTSARVLYVSKGFGAKSNGKVTPFKEFEVKASEKAVAPYLNLARDVTLNWRRDGKIPSGVCSNAFSARAKQCACAVECWSGNYEAGKHHG